MAKITEEEKRVIYELNIAVGNNIKKLMELQGMNKSQLIADFGRRNGYSISVSYLNRLLNHPNETTMPLLFVVQCADYFGVSMETLLSASSDIENAAGSREWKEPLLATEVIKESGAVDDFGFLSEWDESEKDNSTFITDPSHLLFSSVLQTYHCYFYPTSSQENHLKDSILHGILKFIPQDGKCRASLLVETDKKGRDNEPVKKTYRGYAVYSIATQSMYCALKNNIEFCFIIFRYTHLNYAYQDCHMAEALSSSSATIDRYPTALRMFLSREEIQPEHISFITPHLKVNFSRISICGTELSSIQAELPEYGAIISEMCEKVQSASMYNFKEENIFSIAKSCVGEERAVDFITLLRNRSDSFHYTKVGDTVNNTIRVLLKSIGYYKED